MSSKANHSSNNVPFFPPGISHHKVPNPGNSSKKPQSVKQCKSMSRSKIVAITTNIPKYYHNMSKSTPNLKNCHLPSPGKHDFDNSPLLGSNLDLQFYSANLTKSLDRLPGGGKPRKSPEFKPDRPFYPPSKYPSIHDKHNDNIQRFIDTREKYKTPQSRKKVKQLARSQSTNNINKVNSMATKTHVVIRNSPNYGSLPNLTRKPKENVSTNERSKDQNEKVRARIIKTSPDKFVTSYFYPNEDERQKNDRMAQSLRLERSMVSLIGGGSLERAWNQIEINDLDDNSMKSTSARKQLNSFSQDSLDGSRHRKIPAEEVFDDGYREEISQDSEGGVSTTMSPLEDDLPKISSAKSYIDPLHYRADSDQYNIDQVTDQRLPGKTFDSMTFIDIDNPITIRNEFLKKDNNGVMEKKFTSDSCNVSRSAGFDGSLFRSTEDLRESAVKTPHSIEREHFTKPVLDDDHFMEKPNDDWSSLKHDGEALQPDVPFPSDEIYRDPCDKIPLTNDNLLEDEKTEDVIRNNGFVNKKPFTFDFGKDSKICREKNDESLKKLEEDILKQTARFSRFNSSNDSGFSMGNNESNGNSSNNCENVPGTLDNRNNVASTFVDHNNQEYSKIKPEVEQFCDQMLMATGNELKETFPSHHHEADGDLLGSEVFQLPDEPTMDSGMDKEMGHDDVYLEGDPSNIPLELFLSSTLNTKFSVLDQRDIDVLNKEANETNEEQYERRDTDSTASSTNNLSWSESEDGQYFTKQVNGDHTVQNGGLSWLSSPELRNSSNSINGRSYGSTQIENPLKPLCVTCHKPAYFMERISISNIIFHKSCFRCHKCQTHLNFNNCIIHHKRPYCQVHMKPKIRRSGKSASTNKLNQIKERLDNKSKENPLSSNDSQPQKRIFYDGIKSAKTKFFDDATKANDLTVRNLKRITPPRQGVNYGIVESEPIPRDPNVVACGEYQSGYSDDIGFLTRSTSTKETRDHFKQLQNKANYSKESSIGDSEESVSNRRVEMVSVDTKSLRNRFLVASNDSDYKVKKINPSEEIQRLVQLEASTGGDNDVTRTDLSNDAEIVAPISRNKAKEMKERFMNFAQEEKPKQSKFKLDYGEGGIYESNPQENNEDVVKHNYDNTVYLPKNTVKSGLQKIKDLQDIKSKGYQKSNTEPIKLEMDPSLSGVFESTPEQSKADSIAHQNGDKMMEFKDKNYTNEAKKAFLDKSKQEEEEALARSTPHMIDIWKDLCPDSGVFENRPLEQRPDVVKHNNCADRLAIKNENEETRKTEEKTVENDVEKV